MNVSPSRGGPPYRGVWRTSTDLMVKPRCSSTRRDGMFSRRAVARSRSSRISSNASCTTLAAASVAKPLPWCSQATAWPRMPSRSSVVHGSGPDAGRRGLAVPTKAPVARVSTPTVKPAPRSKSETASAINVTAVSNVNGHERRDSQRATCQSLYRASIARASSRANGRRTRRDVARGYKASVT
jgi:hypothetical protein